MTRGKTIWIATIATSAATALFGLLRQPVLVSVGLGLAFSLLNEAFLSLVLRFLSLRLASRWPKVTAFLLPAGWLVKHGALFAGAYFLFQGTDLPVLPFAFAVLGYQIARIGVMMIQPDWYVRTLLPEQHSHPMS